jgi:hypothetical protein
MNGALDINNDTYKLQSLLGKSLYKDKLSFLCEVMQNATDSHAKAGKPNAMVDVFLQSNYNKDYVDSIHIRDYGVSFSSKEEFKKLIGTLLASSKDQVKSTTSIETGGMGIGSIAWCAFSDTCSYNVYKDGIAFTADLKYEEYKGISIEYSGYTTTTEKDGVKFNINCTNRLERISIYSKLAGFKNINYKDNYIYNSEIRYIETPTMIIGNKFNSGKSTFIYYNGYKYEIPFEYVPKHIKIPIGIKYEINELNVTPTREAILIRDLDKEKELFFSKLYTITKNLVDSYNKLLLSYIPDINNTSYKEMVNYYIDRKYSRVKYKNIDVLNFEVEELKYLITILNDFGNLDIEDLKIEYPKNKYTTDITTAYQFTKEISSYYIRNISSTINVYSSTMSRRPYPQRLSNFKDLFVLITNGKLPIHTKESLISYANDNNIDKIHILKELPILNKHSESESENKVNEILINYYNDAIKELVVDVSTIPMLPKKPRTKKDIDNNTKKIVNKEELSFYCGRSSSIGNTIVFDVLNTLTKKDINNSSYRYIYGGKENMEQLKLVAKILKKNIKVIMLPNKKTKEEFESLDSNKFINIEKFKDPEILVKFKKYVSAYKIDQALKTALYKGSHISFIKSFVSEELANKMTELKTYSRIYILNHHNEFMQDVIKIADELNIKDEEIDVTLNTVINFYNKLEFLPVLIDNYNKGYSEEQPILLNVIQDLIKYRKIRMDYQHYKPNNNTVICQ